MNANFKELVGKTIKKIYMEEDYLKFETDDGVFAYTVVGDCCSHSYFHDFYGVSDLLGKKVIDVDSVALTTGDEIAYSNHGGEISVYGYRITYEGSWGDQSAVFSFRNSSNGYYGGWAETTDPDVVVKEITSDTVFV